MVRSPGAWRYAKPMTKACAGSATRRRVAAISSTLPDVLEGPNRDQRNGQVMAEKMPASAAVMGVGVIFMSGAMLGHDQREAHACGQHGHCSRCGKPEDANPVRFNALDELSVLFGE